MTKVRVSYAGQLKAALGQSDDEIALEDVALDSALDEALDEALDGGPTVGELLSHLVELHGTEFEKRLFESPGVLRPGILLCVGDAHVGDDLSLRLSDGNEVTLLMAISGG